MPRIESLWMSGDVIIQYEVFLKIQAGPFPVFGGGPELFSPIGF